MKHPRKQSNSVCTAYYNEVTINNACQTMPQHVLYGMTEGPAAAKPGATKNKHLPAKKKLLVAEIHKEDKISWPKHSRLYGNSNILMNIQFETSFELFRMVW